MGGIRLKIWYKGKPVECDICQNEHVSRDCPMCDKCRRCKQPGHMQRDCPNEPNAWNSNRNTAVPAGPSRDPTPSEASRAPAGSAPSSSQAPRQGDGGFIGLSNENSARKDKSNEASNANNSNARDWSYNIVIIKILYFYMSIFVLFIVIYLYYYCIILVLFNLFYSLCEKIK